MCLVLFQAELGYLQVWVGIYHAPFVDNLFLSKDFLIVSHLVCAASTYFVSNAGKDISDTLGDKSWGEGGGGGWIGFSRIPNLKRKIMLILMIP